MRKSVMAVLLLALSLFIVSAPVMARGGGGGHAGGGGGHPSGGGGWHPSGGTTTRPSGGTWHPSTTPRPSGGTWHPSPTARPGGNVGHPGGNVGRPGGNVGHPGGNVGRPGGNVGHPGGNVGRPGGVGHPGHIGGGHPGHPGDGFHNGAWVGRGGHRYWHGGGFPRRGRFLFAVEFGLFWGPFPYGWYAPWDSWLYCTSFCVAHQEYVDVGFWAAPDWVPSDWWYYAEPEDGSPAYWYNRTTDTYEPEPGTRYHGHTITIVLPSDKGGYAVYTGVWDADRSQYYYLLPNGEKVWL